METYVPTEEQQNQHREWLRKHMRCKRADQRDKFYMSEKHRLAVMRTLWHRARKSSAEASVPFDLEVGDLAIPLECPILHIPLIVKSGPRTDNTPSLDRIIPRLGYVKGNVQMISWRANRIKNDSSFEDLIALGEWAKTQRLKEALNG